MLPVFVYLAKIDEQKRQLFVFEETMAKTVAIFQT
jgi:hypothetical protein